MGAIRNSLFALMLLSSPQLLWGNTVYQWTDENGVVHFSQTAPADKDQAAEETSLRKAALTGGTFAPPRAEPETNTQPESTPQNAESTYKKNPQACSRARDMLATLNTGARIKLRDPETGEIIYAGEEDIAEQRRRANAAVKTDC